MRNLKRALSLTLASVMLLGMMVVGSSAASYPDVEDTHNVEAIEVLQAIKVMVGDDNGNFGPDDQVNRAQMAVVMALLLDLDYDYYKGTNPFWDVPSWAEPYVAACYANGIVSGYNATTYGAGDPVTAVQAASMMMRALGYFQYQSDYKDGFELSTVKQASKISLFKDVNAASNTTALTRNQVAQLALNTLETAMVDAKDNTLNISGESGGMSMSVTGGQVDYIVRTSQEKFAQAINKTDKGGTETDGRQGCTVELGEQLFNGDLIKDEGVSDDFGHPAVTWKLRNTEIGTYEDDSDLVQTWTAKVTKDAMYKAMGKNTVDALKASAGDVDGTTLHYWVDGSDTNVVKGNISNFADRNNTGKINNDAADTGNGTVTKLYVDEDDNATIVVVNTYVYQAVSDYNSSNDNVRIATAGDTGDFPINLDNYTLKGEDFDLESVKEDDYLLVTAYKSGSSYKVASVKPAEVVTGEVTGYKLTDNVTVDDKDYSYSLKTSADGVKSEVQTTGNQVALVLDEYGYVIAVDTTLVGGNYVFITAADNALSFSNVIAHAYFADGTQEDVTLKKVAGSTSKTDLKAAKGWYTYTKNDANQYTLNAITGSYDKAYDAGASAYVNSGDKKVLVQGNNKLPDITNASGIRTNSKTQFVIVDDEGDVYTYAGTSAAPDITVITGPYVAGYVWNDNTDYATYVFISVENAADASVDTSTEDDVFYFVLEQDGIKGTGDDRYYIYNAIVDGKKDKIYTDDEYTEYRLYTKVKRDTKTERITDMKEVDVGKTDDDWKKITVNGGTVEFKGSSLTIGGNSFEVIDDSQMNLIVAKKASDVTSDKDAKYELHIGKNAGTVGSPLKDKTVSGYYYIVTKDAYKNGAGNTELKYLFLYVTSDDSTAGADVTAAVTAIQGMTGDALKISETVRPIADEAAMKAAILAAVQKVAGKYVTVTIKDWPTGASVVVPVDGTALDPDGTEGKADGVTFNVTSVSGGDATATTGLNFVFKVTEHELTAAEQITAAKTDVTAVAVGGILSEADVDAQLDEVKAMLADPTEAKAKAAVQAAVESKLGDKIEVEWIEYGAYTAPAIDEGGFAKVEVWLKEKAPTSRAMAAEKPSREADITMSSGVEVPADAVFTAAVDAIDAAVTAHAGIAADNGGTAWTTGDGDALLTAASFNPTLTGATAEYAAGNVTLAGGGNDGTLAVTATISKTGTDVTDTYEFTLKINQ